MAKVKLFWRILSNSKSKEYEIHAVTDTRITRSVFPEGPSELTSAATFEQAREQVLKKVARKLSRGWSPGRQALPYVEPCFSPDGKHLIAGTSDFSMTSVIDLADGQVVADIHGDPTGSFRPKESFFLDDKVLLIQGDVTSLFSWSDIRLRKSLPGEGRIISSAGGKLLHAADRRARVLDAHTFKPILTISEQVYSGAISPDGKCVLVLPFEHWSAGGGLVLYDLAAGSSREIPVFAGRLYFSPDGKFAIAAEDTDSEKRGRSSTELTLLKTKNWERVHTFAESTYDAYNEFELRGRFAGKRFYYYNQNKIFEYDSETGSVREVMKVGRKFGGFDVSVDGQTLIASMNGRLVQHDLKTSKNRTIRIKASESRRIIPIARRFEIVD